MLHAKQILESTSEMTMSTFLTTWDWSFSSAGYASLVPYLRHKVCSHFWLQALNSDTPIILCYCGSTYFWLIIFWCLFSLRHKRVLFIFKFFGRYVMAFSKWIIYSSKIWIQINHYKECETLNVISFTLYPQVQIRHLNSMYFIKLPFT